jgi:23S rRNA pseudouridine1911/1915/1917 synthase
MDVPAGWRPEALNSGWTYCDRVRSEEQSARLSDVMERRHRHSSAAIWQQRMASGEITLNGLDCPLDVEVKAGDWIRWARPPWVEAAVPDQWEVIHDDGDVLVVNKPSGLPVMPGGGFLVHTLTSFLERGRRSEGEALVPKPIHRLGRFTSGLQVCARRPETRAALSKQFRPEGDCQKTYLALTHRLDSLQQSQTLVIQTDVVERQHPLLGWIWGPEPMTPEPLRKRLSAHSEVQLKERRGEGRPVGSADLHRPPPSDSYPSRPTGVSLARRSLVSSQPGAVCNRNARGWWISIACLASGGVALAAAEAACF